MKTLINNASDPNQDSMKKFKQKIITGALVLGTFALAYSATATTIVDTGNGGETDLHTALGVADNAALNAIQWADSDDQYFKIGGAVTSIILEQAGNAAGNIFGVFNKGGTAEYDIFPGAANPASPSKTVTFSGGRIYIDNVDSGAFPLNALGEVGFYLKPNGNTPAFYSDSTKNSAGQDQMVTFSGVPGAIVSPDTDFSPNQNFILAFEDIAYGNSDKDFNDMVIQMTVVPEPSTYIAGALLLIPLLAQIRRMRRTS